LILLRLALGQQLAVLAERFQMLVLGYLEAGRFVLIC
jgi:hypothetical protein